MKDLPPSQREKTRYLQIKIHSDSDIEIGPLVNKIWEESISYLGVEGMSKVNMWFMGKEYSSKDKKGIIRIQKDMVDQFVSALLFIDSVDGQECFFEVSKISGSINKLKD